MNALVDLDSNEINYSYGIVRLSIAILQFKFTSGYCSNFHFIVINFAAVLSFVHVFTTVYMPELLGNFARPIFIPIF